MDGAEGLELATTAAKGHEGPAPAGAASPYLVSVHGVLLLQLTLTHCLIFLLIFLQLLGRYLPGGRRGQRNSM